MVSSELMEHLGRHLLSHLTCLLPWVMLDGQDDVGNYVEVGVMIYRRRAGRRDDQSSEADGKDSEAAAC
ncbi:hypothetical protein PG999_004569 [Apiospora kogelbergensis]|uniref:Uncharacterized protein n=1 Tax=Apiospora kogelbergensis TaxID=1337665 RepID=A0AAW0QZN0_9PEZI